VLFVDTHCHLNYKTFQQDLDDVIQRAAEVGVYRIVVPGLDLASSRQALQLADKYEPVYAAVGVYPGEADGFNDEQISEFLAMTTHPKVVAIGEIGLDYYHRNDDKENQLIVLRSMLDIATKTHLPLILHSRSSIDDLTQIILKWKENQSVNQPGGIFHAFEGDIASASQITAMGFYLGVGGPITYKNAVSKHELLSKISLTHVVIETDGPFLPPQKHRGTRNEPGYIPLIAEKIAELQGCTIEKVADITTSNAQTLFHWIE
jgi:TatD DNase family protein